MQKIDYTRVTTATVPATATANTASVFYEPVGLATMVNYLKQNYGTVQLEDALVETMIRAARHWIEEKTGRAIVRQTVTYLVSDDEDPILNVMLPFHPIVLTNSDVTSVKRVDAEGTETLLIRNTDYYLRGLSQLTVTLNRTWSSGIISGMNYQDIKVVYEAGYATLSDIPAPLKLAIMKLAAENYVNRENSVDWAINAAPIDVLKLIAPYTDMVI